MIVIDWILIVALSALTAVVVYLFVLAIFGIIGPRKYPDLSAQYDFLILVPAHNEEQVIPDTLKSLSRLQPVGRIEIAVIADNCTDNTARVAREHGATVLERSNLTEIGKGYALEWAMSRYDLSDYTAVAIVDADTLVEPDMLLVMAKALESGAGAVQLRYDFVPVTQTSLARLQHMAGAVENIFFYNGRSALNLPILLRGTGMAIRTHILKEYPWDSHSLTEDVDYAVRILRRGTKITFSAESRVTSAAVSSYHQSLSQKKRWASGTFNLIADHLFSLVGDAFAKGRFALLELGLSFMLLSRPTLIIFALVMVPLALLASDQLRIWLLIWPLGLIFLLILYLCLGVFLVDDKKRAAMALLHIPIFGAWMIGLQIAALFQRRRLQWTRTDRNGS